MIRTQVYIPDDLFLRAKLAADIEGISISELMRDGIKIRLEQQQKKRKSSKKGALDDFIGCIKVKKSAEAALNHNDIYDYVLPRDHSKK